MALQAAFKLEPGERDKIIQYLIESSYPGAQFFVMIIASAVIASVGLVLNNVAVIIGSMLVAPFLAPVLSLSLGIVLSDFTLIRRSAIILGKAAAIAAITAFAVSAFVPPPTDYNPEIISRGAPSIPYIYVAIAAGVAASLAVARPQLSAFLVGVAVSVSILPPLAVTGIGISGFDTGLITGSLQLFFVNLIGIIFSGIIVFSLMGIYPSRTKVEKAIKVEEKKLKAEKKEEAPIPKKKI